MVDACTVERASGRVMDPDTGQYVTTYDPVWSGKCRVQVSDTAPSTPRAGGQEFSIDRLEVQLPVDGTGGIEVGDRVTVTTATFDDSLTGRHFTVVFVLAKTHATSRRLQVQEVTA